MKIFVTGGTGCLGIHVLNRLADMGQEVVALVRRDSDLVAIPACDQIRFVTGDILDTATYSDAMRGVEVVIHCAADIGFSGGKANRFDVNNKGTMLLAEQAFQGSLKHFIHISTAAVMGDVYDGERDETAPCVPADDYAKSKYEAELFLLSLHEAKSFPLTILRPTLIYGAYDRNGMKTIIELIDKNRFFIFGDGNNRKSPVAAHNVVEAITSVMGKEAAMGETFIVTDGESISINEMCFAIADLLGTRRLFLKIPAWLCPIVGRAGDCAKTFLGNDFPVTSGRIAKFMSNNTYSSAKIMAEMGYTPQKKCMEGLREEIVWYRKCMGRALSKAS